MQKQKHSHPQDLRKSPWYWKARTHSMTDEATVICSLAILVFALLGSLKVLDEAWIICGILICGGELNALLLLQGVRRKKKLLCLCGAALLIVMGVCSAFLLLRL